MSNNSDKLKKGVHGEYNCVFDGANLLEYAEYILNYYLDYLKGYNNETLRRGIAEKQILNLIRACLRIKWNKQDFNARYDDSTLKAVADLLKWRLDFKGDSQYVITYNYDNLLEYALINKERLNPNKLKVITYRDKPKREKLKPPCINISHIHGYIDVDKMSDDCDWIVLSENSYRDVESNAYGWINSSQAYAMNSYTCLFIGFSGEDYNFRRIVRHNSDGECYIFFTVDDILKSVLRCERGLHGTEEVDLINNFISNRPQYQYEEHLMKFLIESKTKYWQRFHVNPIWVTIDEMPQKILGLK